MNEDPERNNSKNVSQNQNDMNDDNDNNESKGSMKDQPANKKKISSYATN